MTSYRHPGPLVTSHSGTGVLVFQVRRMGGPAPGLHQMIVFLTTSLMNGLLTASHLSMPGTRCFGCSLSRASTRSRSRPVMVTSTLTSTKLLTRLLSLPKHHSVMGIRCGDDQVNMIPSSLKK